MTTYAIIGAGMAGLTCAQRLSHTNSHISLWEKSRGIGGRMAQRRWESTRFDHGAQYLQAKSPEFQQQLNQWQQQGHLQAWPSHIYFEDINALSQFELVEVILDEVYNCPPLRKKDAEAT